jgi:tetratricopeptide (TPR) repeat protein
VVVNSYVTSGEDGQPTRPEPQPAEQQALSVFDEGLARFKRGEYPAALAKFDQALRELPGDAVVHEVRCLTLFAVGDYTAAAAGLNSLLSSAPGMDWTSVSSLYGEVEDYTTQLRKLEQFVDTRSEDAAARFVLAYQYLMLGEQDLAVAMLREVTRLQPQDSVATRMLTALDPPPAPAQSQANVSRAAENPTEGAAAAGLETDLIGQWQATSEQATIELTIQEDFTFVWQAQSPGQPPIELSGNFAGTASGIELITTEQGVLAGTVVSGGPDAWTFHISEAAASDPGLSFKRVK